MTYKVIFGLSCGYLKDGTVFRHTLDNWPTAEKRAYYHTGTFTSMF